MSDLERLTDGKWIQLSTNKFENINYVKVNEFHVPLVSLRTELEDYKKLNREKDQIKIKKIEEKLKQ